MELLETRFYSLAEIREITGKDRKRDVTHLLDLWGYQYVWKNKKALPSQSNQKPWRDSLN